MTPEAWLVLKVLGVWCLVSALGCALRAYLLRNEPLDDGPPMWPKTLMR